MLGLSAKLGKELDVGKCWDYSFGFFLSRVVGAARLLGLFLQVLAYVFSFALFQSIVGAARFLGNLLGLFGEELNVSISWVEL